MSYYTHRLGHRMEGLNVLSVLLKVFLIIVLILFKNTQARAHTNPAADNKVRTARTATMADVALTMRVNAQTARVGEVVTYYLTIANHGSIPITGIITTLTMPADMTLQGSLTPSQGSVAGLLWSIPVLSEGDSATLNITVRLNTEGPQYLIAEVTAMNEQDNDSQPNNQNYLEDDIAVAAVSVPYQYCEGQKIEIKAAAPAGMSNYKWYKNDTLIQGQNSPTLTITSVGMYTFAGNMGAGSCPVGLNCPIIVTEQPRLNIRDSSIVVCKNTAIDLTKYIDAYISFTEPVWRLNTADGSVVTTPTVVTPSVTSTYFLIAHNTSGCSDTAQVRVIVNPIPNVAINASKSSIALGDSSVLTATGGQYYNWNTNETTQSITIKPVASSRYIVTVRDSNACEASSVILIAVNTSPEANRDDTTTAKNTPIEIVVLANDRDSDGLPSSVEITEMPKNGTAQTNSDGTITYIPNNNFTGKDTLIYEMCDNGIPQLCDTALVIISVNTIIQPPIAVNDTANTKTNEPILISVALNDTIPGDTSGYTITIIDNPAQGQADVQPNGKINYTPDKDWCFTRPDLFSYRLCKNNLCDTAWVLVNVTCTNVNVNTAISPNGDGINEVFVIDGAEKYPNNHLIVFNRWGNSVFDAKGYKSNWNGTWNGKPLPSGTYFYIFYPEAGQFISGYVQINY